MGRLRAFWLALLTASAVAVLSAGTLAAYSATEFLEGTITAARMAFAVNGSGQETQSLGVRELRPGGSTSYDVAIDTAGTEVALDVSVQIAASGSDLPPGLSVRVDGAPIGGAGTWSATYPNMAGSSRTVPVAISWDATPDQLKALYPGSRNFSLSLSATVTATQSNVE